MRGAGAAGAGLAGAGFGAAGGTWADSPTPTVNIIAASVMRFIALSWSIICVEIEIGGGSAQPRNDFALFERLGDEIQLRLAVRILQPDDLREHELEVFQQVAHRLILRGGAVEQEARRREQVAGTREELLVGAAG